MSNRYNEAELDSMLIRLCQRQQHHTFRVKRAEKRRSVWKIAVPAVCAFVLAVTGAFAFNGQNSSKNSFVITAGASETASAQALGDSAVEISNRETGYGFMLQTFSGNGVEPYFNSIGKRDFFNDFKLSDLQISGSNIDTVTFEVTADNMYFKILPSCDDTEVAEGTKSFNRDAELRKYFSDILPLSRSQYSEEELEEHGDGLYGKFCDGFTCKSTDFDGASEIKLSEMISLVTETNRADSEIEAYVSAIEAASESNERIEREEYYKRLAEGLLDKAHAISTEMEANDEIISDSNHKIQQKLFDNAAIALTVKFRDGSAQTKRILLNYEQEDEEGNFRFLTARLAE